MAPAKPVNPKTTHYEFFGPVGTGFLTLTLPLVTYALFFLCPSSQRCSVLEVPELPSVADLFDATTLAVYLGWFAFQALLYIVLPGGSGEGLPIPRLNNARLKYKFNGLNAFLLSVALFAAVYFLDVLPVTFIYDHYVHLLTASILFSFALSFYLYASSFKSGALLAEGGNSGNPIYDFFIGRELNPRIGSFDLKYFCELRPGLIGWALINFALAAQQYKAFGSVTNSMVLVCAFQGWYVMDAFLSESSILSTMDIVQDGFGFMLAFGDLAWVPFTYSLQARYLADHPVDLSPLHLAAVLLVQAVGYWIFRAANGQKDAFRKNPNDPALAHLKTLPTERGTKLLISGWWGTARHINYFGDLLMGLAWCLPCGFGSPIPYFYSIYFTILLIHRDSRDDHNCSIKYGKDWDKYKKIVPYRIVPYIY
eukprot:m.222486 g.222486  ORF g.222486 m.222486 type:complete len:424 (-) comp16040_c0_seq1:24-1295(-)